jgi:hypothetical protein
LTSLVKQIDKKINENAKLKSFVVIMTKDAENTKESLKKLAQEASVKEVPLTMIGEKDGPSDYEIASDADITVLMWKDHKVKVNNAFKGELTEKDIETVMSGIPKLLSD